MAGQVYRLMTMGRLMSLLPESRLFRFKALVYKTVGGLDIDPTARIYSSVRFHTYPVSIGARTHVGARRLFTGANGCAISLGSDCDIAPEVAFLTGTHDLGTYVRRAGREMAYPVRVGNGT